MCPVRSFGREIAQSCVMIGECIQTIGYFSSMAHHLQQYSRVFVLPPTSMI